MDIYCCKLEHVKVIKWPGICNLAHVYGTSGDLLFWFKLFQTSIVFTFLCLT